MGSIKMLFWKSSDAPAYPDHLSKSEFRIADIQLDHPLTISDRKNVRIILLIPETDEENDEPYDEPDESVFPGLHQALSEVKAGQTNPLSQLWDGIDV